VHERREQNSFLFRDICGSHITQRELMESLNNEAKHITSKSFLVDFIIIIIYACQNSQFMEASLGVMSESSTN
jgi:hypothetical protein